ncbi:MAG: mannose-1-phosphate guanylyltransferase, partial [Bacteroidaceae bacterium]|nr:mannose-1-phosphate guanylyltransferase [Bacteroidaceae bacterium]
DMGTWGSLYERLSHDLNGNAIISKNVELCESHNCIVHAMQEKRVVIIGMNDCIVAEQDGELLICRMNEEGRIKDFSDKH